MSAFICSDLHINTIVTWAVENQALPYDITPEAAAAALYSENVKSVNYRYNERTKRTGFVYTPVDIGGRTAAEIVKLCHCLDYQSCEHKGWPRSKAKHILNCIIDRAVTRLPGYGQAEWSI